MKFAFASAFLTVLAYGNPAVADISSLSGDLDYGPKRVVFQSGFYCYDALDIFKIYEVWPNGGTTDMANALADKKLKSGSCKILPTMSVTVRGLRIARVYGKAMPEKSIYVIPRIIVDGTQGYTFPNNLGAVGFEIIKQSQHANKEEGLPIRQ